MKKVFLYSALAALLICLLGHFTYTIILLYFGVASLYTTAYFYLLLLIAGAVLLKLSSRLFNYTLSPNAIMVLVSIWAGLYIGEVSLRMVFKKNLTYTERQGTHYNSYYSYLFNWDMIKSYLSHKENYWYSLVPPNYLRQYIVEKHTFFHQYNSYALRDDEKPPAPDDSLNLIMGIGDSFTEGIGTTQDSTWLRFLEHDINSCAAQKIRTVNAGVAGSDVYFEYILLEKLLLQYHPNTVVLAINSSDIDDIVIKGGRERFKPDGRLEFRKPPVWEPLYATSFIFRSVMHSRFDLDWTLLTMKEKEMRKAEAIDSIGDCIKRFHELGKQKGFKLVVVFHPREAEVISGIFPYDALAAKLATDTNYTIINMKDEFANSERITKANSGEFFWPLDLHHNTKGYRVLGELLAERLRGNYPGCQ